MEIQTGTVISVQTAQLFKQASKGPLLTLFSYLFVFTKIAFRLNCILGHKLSSDLDLTLSHYPTNTDCQSLWILGERVWIVPCSLPQCWFKTRSGDADIILNFWGKNESR